MGIRGGVGGKRHSIGTATKQVAITHDSFKKINLIFKPAAQSIMMALRVPSANQGRRHAHLQGEPPLYEQAGGAV